jgi:hypothetical protein
MIIEDEESWHSNAGILVNLAREFYRWAPFQAPDTILTLEKLMDDVIVPEEPEWERDDDWRGDSTEPYWTIERIFEDL